jgi:hypothetical protein
MEFEVEGSEDFVRSEMEYFLPYLRAAAGMEPPEDEEAGGPLSLKRWYEKKIRVGQNPTMQDHILIFAYYLHKEKRQFVFTPDDMKASFSEVGREIPKSLLQIMGSLKRDHNLLWPGDKRGEYCLLPSGIQHVEKLLGIERPEPPPPPAESAEPEAAPPPREEPPAAESGEARKRFRSLFTGEVTEEEG